MYRYDDEAAMRNIRHTEHRSGWREAQAAAIIVWILGAIFIYPIESDWFPSFAKVLLICFLGVGAGAFFIWWIGGSGKRHQERVSYEHREIIAAERERQLEEAKASGAFDRWESKK